MTDTQGAALQDDVLAPDFNHDPHPFFARLREAAPVHHTAAQRGWLVTRYDDAVAALTDQRLSSDRVRPLIAAMDESKQATAGPIMHMIKDWMVVTDRPAHTRLRRLAAVAFNPKRVAAAEPRIRQIVDEVLDEFIREGHEDLVEHFAFPLPAIVIAEIIGAPPEDREHFKGWSEELALVAFSAGGEARAERHQRALRGLQAMEDYFDGLIEEAKRRPAENMVSDLLAGDGKGNRLDDDEIKSMLALMLFAGHETTTNTIASTTLLLLQHPDQLELLRGDPSLAGGLVEEGLRLEGAIKILTRWVVEDLELRGAQIKAGDRVFVSPMAANRDPERFPDPDRMDITRSPNPHIAFGKGIHACIGAQLARLEMRLALAAVVERLPNLRLADPDAPLKWRPILAARSLEELRIAHDA